MPMLGRDDFLHPPPLRAVRNTCVPYAAVSRECFPTSPPFRCRIRTRRRIETVQVGLPVSTDALHGAGCSSWSSLSKMVSWRSLLDCVFGFALNHGGP